MAGRPVRRLSRPRASDHLVVGVTAGRLPGHRRLGPPGTGGVRRPRPGGGLVRATGGSRQRSGAAAKDVRDEWLVALGGRGPGSTYGGVLGLNPPIRLPNVPTSCRAGAAPTQSWVGSESAR